MLTQGGYSQNQFIKLSDNTRGVFYHLDYLYKGVQK